MPYPSCIGHGILGSVIAHPTCTERSRFFTEVSPSWQESVETAHRWCAKLNLGPSKQVIEELPKIRVSLQYTKKHIRIPVPNLTTSSKDLQFAETSSRSCEVQGLSHFLLCDLCQHRPSAGFLLFRTSSKTSTHCLREVWSTESTTVKQRWLSQEGSENTDT